MEEKDVIWQARPSHFVKLPFYFAILVGATILGGIAWLLPAYYAQNQSLADYSQLIFFLAATGWFVAGFLLLWGLVAAINHHYTRYTLTEDTLYTRSNFFLGRHHTLWVHLVRDVHAEMPLFMRVFGYGRVVVKSRDQTDPVLVLDGIRQAPKVKVILNDLAPIQAAKHRVISVGQ